MPLRVLHGDAVGEAVRAMAVESAFELDARVLSLVERALASETEAVARDVLLDIVENARVAREERRPLCQDTGVALVWAELGRDVRLAGGSLQEAADEGVRRAWEEAALRASVVDGPLTRVNTGDNAPAVVHVDLIAGDRLALRFMAKGGGSENQSRSTVLAPSMGREGVVKWIAEAVVERAPFACPPVVVGVGLGGTCDVAAWLAKRALFRPVGDRSPDPELASVERDVLELVNASGVGPMGLGGRTTALACAVEAAPCHIASLPVAVCLGCHSHRVRSVEL